MAIQNAVHSATAMSNSRVIANGLIRHATKQPIDIDLGELRRLYTIDGICERCPTDNGSMTVVFTTEKRAGATYSQTDHLVIRPDVVASNDKLDVSVKPASELNGERMTRDFLTAKQLTQLPKSARQYIEAVYLAPVEEQNVIIVDDDLLNCYELKTGGLSDGEKILFLNTDGGHWAEDCQLYRGDAIVVDDAEAGIAYRISAENFANAYELK